jgi:glycosyltransferase involved in cell wall biosynthesis
MSYILKLAGWYPHRANPFNGDFVQRHALSIALHQPVVVVFAVKDDTVKEMTIEKKVTMNGRLTEYICYYPQKKWFNSLWAYWYYKTCFKKAFAEINKQYGLPAVVHVNIAWKAGLWAQWLRRKFKLPYIITENWTGYYEADPENLFHKPRPVQQWIKKIFRQAALFVPVTKNLGERCNELFGNIQYRVVENAVDTSLFYYTPLPQRKKIKIVHVSTMGYQKNIEGLLRVLQQVALRSNDFELTLIGPYSAEVKALLTDHTALNAVTTLTGNIAYTEVAAQVRHADMMLLFSRYENLPCVILEALCCGVPVLASTVGGIDEVINKENGLLAASEDETALLQALLQMIHTLPQYNRAAIAAAATAQYSYAAIGQKFVEVYAAIGKK